MAARLSHEVESGPLGSPSIDFDTARTVPLRVYARATRDRLRAVILCRALRARSQPRIIAQSP